MNGEKFDLLPKSNILTAKAKLYLENHCSIIHQPAKSILQPIGSRCQTLYFVLKGAARIFYLKDGEDYTEYFAVSNDLIVRANSLLKNEPTQKGIETISATEFLAIEGEVFFNAFVIHPCIEKWFNALLQEAYLESLNRVEQFQLKTPQERYNELISTSPELLQVVPLKHLASYLGITQVSLSRIRARR